MERKSLPLPRQFLCGQEREKKLVVLQLVKYPE